MVLYERLTVPAVQEDARESLILQLTRTAQTAFDNRLHALTQWRLKQARSLVKPVETNHRVLETLKQMGEIRAILISVESIFSRSMLRRPHKRAWQVVEVRHVFILIA